MDGGAWHGLDRKIGGADDDGCAFMIDDRQFCGAERRRGSTYCTHHHVLCHIAGGTARERYRLREAEALASAVGGRQGRAFRTPPDRVLRRLENLTRVFLRSNRSCFVLTGDE
jgi:hypothetical protein